MSTLLKIDVSPRGDHSISRQLSTTFAEKWKAAHSGGTVTTRDLAKTNIPFVDLPWIAGAFTAPDTHSEESKAAIKVSDIFVAELLAADEILLSTPMYNFNIPAALKGWIDHVVRAGKTFSAGPDGFKGLVTGKKVTIIVASGAVYLPGSPFESYDFEVPYLRSILGFIGLTDITFIQAGGTTEISQGKVTPEAFVANFKPETEAAAAK